MNTLNLKVTSPIEWFKIPVTYPAYMWLAGFAVVSTTGFISGVIVDRYVKNKLSEI